MQTTSIQETVLVWFFFFLSQHSQVFLFFPGKQKEKRKKKNKPKNNSIQVEFYFNFSQPASENIRYVFTARDILAIDLWELCYSMGLWAKFHYICSWLHFKSLSNPFSLLLSLPLLILFSGPTGLTFYSNSTKHATQETWICETTALSPNLTAVRSEWRTA